MYPKFLLVFSTFTHFYGIDCFIFIKISATALYIFDIYPQWVIGKYVLLVCKILAIIYF